MAQRTDDGPLKIGARFLDKYEIQGLLGRGGQACVYRGQHTFTGREVAIKLIHSPYGVNDEMLVRAKAEARALGRLDHPNVVAMHDAGVTEDGQIYIVMELLRGCSLRGVLAGHGRLEVEETLRLAIQAGKAVQAAHAVRMIHRDLKPDNLFVIHDNGLKVLDFGIAKMLDEIGFTTRKDVVVGTMMYMSPEQAQGLPITEQSDIYALGLIMFEALIGKQPSVLIFEQDLIERREPYRRPGIADIPPIQVNRIPPLISELDRDIPVYLAHLVQRSIAKVAKQRFSTMGHFVSAMQACLENYMRDEPLAVRRPSGRDLSLPAPKVDLPPVSQRATAPRPASVTPSSAQATPARLAAPQTALAVGPHDTEVMKPAQNARVQTPPTGTRLSAQQSSVTVKAPQAVPKQKTPASGPFKPATPPPVTVGAGSAGNNVARANRLIVRNALVGGSAFGAALSAAAMIYFGPTNHSASQPPPALEAVTTASASPTPAIAPPPPTLAAAPQGALSPDPLPQAVAQVASVVPAAAVPAPPRAIPTAHAAPTLARAAAAKPVDKIDQRHLLQIESGLGEDRSPKPNASAPPGKPAEERKKAIYGD